MYRRTGILMIVMHLLLSGAMAELVFVERGFGLLPGPTFHISVIYAAYKICCAVYNVFKARRSNDIAVSVLRSISLADASVSALALQTVAVRRMSESNLYIPINLVSSALVSIFTLSLGIYAVFWANKAMKEAKEHKDN